MKTHSSNPHEDLLTIREMMERSSKFLSISGLSGIFAGLSALTGAIVAWVFILDAGRISYSDLIQRQEGLSFSGGLLNLALDALVVLACAILGAVYFSSRKAKKAGQPLWTSSTKRLLIHFAIPLLTGGCFVLILVMRHHLELIPAAMLIFYGLSLVNAGKFTLGEIHYLGLTVVGLGILAGLVVSEGLLIWTIGFGFFHMLYGAVMYYRYER